MNDRNTDTKGRPYTLAPADANSLEPWLARDGQGGYLLCVGVEPVATLGSSAVALLKAARPQGVQYRLVLEACAPHPAA